MKYFFLKGWKLLKTLLRRCGLNFKVCLFCLPPAKNLLHEACLRLGGEQGAKIQKKAFYSLLSHATIPTKIGIQHNQNTNSINPAVIFTKTVIPLEMWKRSPDASTPAKAGIQLNPQFSNRIDIKKERAPLTILLLMIASLCYSCLSPPTNPKAKPILIDKATLELSSDGKTLQGTGRVLFDQPLFGLYSKELYFVKAEFLHPYSSLILHSHLSDFSKQDGIRVLLHKENNDLNLYVSTPGYKTQKLSTEPDYFLGNQRIALYIEIENGTENFVDVAVWNFYINPRGNLKIPSPLFSRQNQLTFSNNPLFYSKGQGILWGTELNEIRLIEIFRESPNSL